MPDMTTQEAKLRCDLEQAVTRLRSAITRLPTLDAPSDALIGDAAGTVDEANDALREALSITGAMDELAASDELALLVGNAECALDMIREMLTLICAEIDIRSAA